MFGMQPPMMVFVCAADSRRMFGLMSYCNTCVRAADSGSWSQTEDGTQQAQQQQQAGSTPTVKATTPCVLESGGRRASGRHPKPCIIPLDTEATLNDDEDAATALVTLGQAAEAELQQQRLAEEAAAYGDVVDAKDQNAHGDHHLAADALRPPKKRRLMGAAPDYNKLANGMSWHQYNSSSTSSQSACQLSAGPGSVPASPVSPADDVHRAAARGAGGGGVHRTLAGHAARGSSRGGQEHQHQHADMQRKRLVPPADNDGRITPGVSDAAQQLLLLRQSAAAAPAAPPDEEEFLPVQQLIQGISAVKSKGPALFQGSSSSSGRGSSSSAATSAAAPLQDGLPSAAGIRACLPVGRHVPVPLSAAGRYSGLMALVGQIQPQIEQHCCKNVAAMSVDAVQLLPPQYANGVGVAMVPPAVTGPTAPPLFCSPHHIPAGNPAGPGLYRVHGEAGVHQHFAPRHMQTGMTPFTGAHMLPPGSSSVLPGHGGAQHAAALLAGPQGAVAIQQPGRHMAATAVWQQPGGGMVAIPSQGGITGCFPPGVIPIRLTIPVMAAGSPVLLQALPPGLKPVAAPPVLDLRQPQGVQS